MKNPTIVLTGRGGLNFDDSPTAMPPDDYPFQQGARNGYAYGQQQFTPTNMKGNTLVAYTYGTAKYKCIGSYEDKQYSIIYFIWASDGNDLILRYFPRNISAATPLGTIELIGTFNWGWLQTTRIPATSVDFVDEKLLYWTDNIKPRKINVVKGDNVNKFKNWNIILPITDTADENVNITITDLAGNQLAEQGFVVTGTPAQKFNQILFYFNTPGAAFYNYMNAVVCTCYMEITEKVTNSYLLKITAGRFFTVPGNWYGPLIDRYTDACKYPPSLAPLCQYQPDLKFNGNYVQDNVFFFRLAYIYDDYEQSKLGSISQIIVNGLNCDGTTNHANNYIDVNFNDQLLLNPATLVLIKYVQICVQEQNTGNWLLVDELPPCQLYDLVNGEPVFHYKFYNNEQTTPIPAIRVNTQYDNVPLEANAQKFANNILAYAGITEGYDAPQCPTVNFKIQVEPVAPPKLFTARGFCNFFQPYLVTGDVEFFPPIGTSPKPIQLSAPILWDSGLPLIPTTTGVNIPFWGGCFYHTYPTSHGEGTVSNLVVDTDQAFNQKRQLLPSGGIPFYLAGTQYWGISKQTPVNGVNQRGDGSIDASVIANNTNRLSIVNYLANVVGSLDGNNAPIQSMFEIRNVPPGKYVLRAASHWCSPGDVLGKGPMYDLNGTSWQQTSTFVYGIVGSDGVWKNDFEIEFEVTDSDVLVGSFTISDRTSQVFEGPVAGIGPDVGKGRAWSSISGYLLDGVSNDGTLTGQTDVPSLQRGVTIEKAALNYPLAENDHKDVGVVYNNVLNEVIKFTDHNGFFHVEWFRFSDATTSWFEAILCTQVGGGIVKGLVAYGDAGTVAGQSALELLALGTITTPFANNQGSMFDIEIILPCAFPERRGDSSTFIEGFVVDQAGNPIANTTVVFEHGRIVTTDSNGFFQLLAWGDMTLGNHNNRIVDSVIFDVSPLCNVTYPNGQSVGPLQITPFGANLTLTPPPYSPTAFFKIANFVINEATLTETKTRKSGGSYSVAIVYRDSQLRQCSPVPVTDIYIPFQTEDLGLYPICVTGDENPFTSPPYPLGSFVPGKRVISWQLPAGFNPPSWAVSYQFLFTTNKTMGRYLQWVVNEVTYLSKVAVGLQPAITTSYQNGDEVAVQLSLSNIVTYDQTNPTSQIGYTAILFTAPQAATETTPATAGTQSDRVRLIYNNQFSVYQGYFDFEVTGYDADTQSVIVNIPHLPFQIESGTIIEIYNPISLADEEDLIYYECGENYLCTAPGTNANAHSVTTAEFTSGDTYWRGRVVQVDDSTDNFIGTFPAIVEDAAVSDFYPSTAQDIGRPQLVSVLFNQQYKYTSFRISSAYLSNTEINGLSVFENINDPQLGLEFGPIVGLVVIGYVMGAVCENKFVSNYLGATLATQPNGSNIEVGSQQGFIQDSRPLLGDYGCQNPACIVEIDGHVFFPDFERGIVAEYDNNGLDQIQKYKAVNYFKKFQVTGVWDAVAAYDRFYAEYMLTGWPNLFDSGTVITAPISNIGTTINFAVNNPALYSTGQIITVNFLNTSNNQTTSFTVNVISVAGNLVSVLIPGSFTFSRNQSLSITMAGAPQTISYQKDKKRWQMFYPFIPENMCGVGQKLVSWNNGNLYVHDTGPIGTFYGVFYPWLLNVIANNAQDLIMIYEAVYLDTVEGTNRVQNWSIPTITNSYGQLSRILKGAFKKLEGYWHSAFRKNLNVNSSITNPIANGDELRSPWLQLSMVNDSTNPVELRGVNVICQLSPGNTKQ